MFPRATGLRAAAAAGCQSRVMGEGSRAFPARWPSSLALHLSVDRLGPAAAPACLVRVRRDVLHRRPGLPLTQQPEASPCGRNTRPGRSFACASCRPRFARSSSRPLPLRSITISSYRACSSRSLAREPSVPSVSRSPTPDIPRSRPAAPASRWFAPWRTSARASTARSCVRGRALAAISRASGPARSARSPRRRRRPRQPPSSPRLSLPHRIVLFRRQRRLLGAFECASRRSCPVARPNGPTGRFPGRRTRQCGTRRRWRSGLPPR